MTKVVSSSPQDYKAKSQHTPRSLHRRPIHEAQENDIETEEEAEIDFSEHPKSKSTKKLYPDLTEDIIKLQQHNKPVLSEKKLKSNRFPKQAFEAEKQVHSTIGLLDSFTCQKCIIYILILICTVIALFYKSIFSDYGSKGMDVENLIGNMQKQFRDQEEKTFKDLKLALNRVNGEYEPKAPAIITLLVNKGAENTASDFSLHLANALAPGQYVAFNESDYVTNEPDNIKLEIDERIRSSLRNNKLNVVIVDMFHKVPLEAAMIFHGYCDHESALFKRVVYLFIVHLNNDFPKNFGRKKLDMVAMDTVRNMWPRASDDLVDSLITRITVNVVNIK